jgi:hypothetical protein
MGRSCSENGRRYDCFPNRHRWEDDIRMGLKEIGINTRNWFDSAQDRDYWRALANVALNLHVP